MKCLWLLTIILSTVYATVCPGGGQCSGVETCCLMSSGQYGCCPYSSAVCCPDREHCCPSGYTCSYNKCQRQSNVSNENVVVKNEKSKFCPNKQDKCPNVFTCCPGKQTGRYFCCPFPNAVCCKDNLHCCPSGATCDLVEMQCKLNGISMPLIRKIDSTSLESSKALLVETAPATPANTVCPDPRYSCSGTDPCCRTPTGVWTCCIYPLGTCCADGVHCCPYGMSCVQSSYCVKGNVTVPTQASPLSKVNSLKDGETCPDGHYCPDGDTCCHLPVASKEYGCCPLRNAVCCSDRIHCCPEGSTCNIEGGYCSSGDLKLPWLTRRSKL